MNSVIGFFRDLWIAREEHKAMVAGNNVYYFDAFPGVPVVLKNFCRAGEKGERIGALISINGHDEVLNLEEPASDKV